VAEAVAATVACTTPEAVAEAEVAVLPPSPSM